MIALLREGDSGVISGNIQAVHGLGSADATLLMLLEYMALRELLLLPIILELDTVQ